MRLDRPTFSPQSAVEPPIEPRATRSLRFIGVVKQGVRKALPFGFGIVAAFLALALYRAIWPPTPPLTQVEVDTSIASAMASATPLPAYSEQVYQIIQPSLVLIQAKVQGEDGTIENDIGTGVVVNIQGDILTSLHVVTRSNDIQLTFADGTQSRAQIVVAQPENDIAVLEAAQLPQQVVPATLGNPGAMSVGDEAYAVGHPFGLYGSMSAGIISGFDRSIQPVESAFQYRRPDPDRCGGQSRQFGWPVAQPQRRGHRHRHRTDQSDQAKLFCRRSALPCRSRLLVAPRERRHTNRRLRTGALLFYEVLAGAVRTNTSLERRARMVQPMNRQSGTPMERVLYEVKKVIVGQDHLLERMVVALLARGHMLVEGVPGLAKTMAIKTLAETIGGEFKRIQFTPDLVPADLIGTRIYNQKTGEFNTVLGPVFTNLLLADEINRAPAKVQSALLEVMQERQVTIGLETSPRAQSLPGAGDPKPDRDRGHLSAARSAGRPLHVQGADRLSVRRPRSL